MIAKRTLAGLPLALLLVGCASFGPLPDELAAALAARAQTTPAAERVRAVATVDSPWFRGVFDAALVEQHTPEPAARLQLFPDLGGKLLDVTVLDASAYASLPAAELRLDWQAHTGPPPRELLTMFAVHLIEGAAPITPERVRGARPVGEDWELELEPVWRGVRAHVLVSAEGTVLKRCYVLRHARWSETGGVIEGGELLLELTAIERQPLDAIPAAMFEASPLP